MSTPDLTILILEDEALIGDQLRRLLNRIGYEKIELATTVEEAEQIIETKSPDVAFLDILISGSPGGFTVAKLCGEREIPFIFLTSYEDKKTIDTAAKLQPAAYLIKPFAIGEITATMQVVIETQLKPSSMAIKDGLKSIRVSPREIVWLEVHTPYVKLHFESRIITIRSSLQDLLDELPSNMFVRVHRSYAVNREKIKHMTRTEVHIGDKRLSISRKYKDQIAEIKRD